MSSPLVPLESDGSRFRCRDKWKIDVHGATRRHAGYLIEPGGIGEIEGRRDGGTRRRAGERLLA
jgi:hypothetical protein